MFNASGHYLEVVATWGKKAFVETTFAVQDCWAVRLGQPYEVVDAQGDLVCTHFVEPPTEGVLCLPMTVRGETVGILCLGTGRPDEGDPYAGRHQLAVTVAESIKLSLATLRLRGRLHEQATKDSLTGLFNRRYLEDTLPRELHGAARRSAPLSLAMIDLDHFKEFNERFGHEAGDLVLREAGRVFGGNLRTSDIACRHGGDEFVVVLPDSTAADAVERIDGLRRLVADLTVLHDGRIMGTITFSAGIATAPQDGSTSVDLLGAADAALFAAKQGGRNNVRG